jgi:hypothetical protein
MTAGADGHMGEVSLRVGVLDESFCVTDGLGLRVAEMAIAAGESVEEGVIDAEGVLLGVKERAAGLGVCDFVLVGVSEGTALVLATSVAFAAFGVNVFVGVGEGDLLTTGVAVTKAALGDATGFLVRLPLCVLDTVPDGLGVAEAVLVTLGVGETDRDGVAGGQGGRGAPSM